MSLIFPHKASNPPPPKWPMWTLVQLLSCRYSKDTARHRLQEDYIRIDEWCQISPILPHKSPNLDPK